MIVIKSPPVKFTVGFQSNQAPCLDCPNFDRGNVTCLTAQQKLTAAVEQQCADGGWKRAARVSALRAKLDKKFEEREKKTEMTPPIYDDAYYAALQHLDDTDG
jgi:hypothetical protein